MTPVAPKRPARGAPAPGLGPARLRARPRRGVSGVLKLARASGDLLAARAPGTLRSMKAGAHGMTVALQILPDSTLRWLAAASVGLAAGLRLAGAPRVVAAAGVTPALVLGAAIVLRPIEPETASQPHRAPHRRAIHMTDEHTKGAMSTAQGKVEEALGKMTGDKEEQAHGKAKQAQGHAQKVLGDVQDAVRERKDKS